MKRIFVKKLIAVLLVIALTSAIGIVLSACQVLCSHDWQDATCSAPKTCSKCGKTEGEALSHVIAEYTVTDSTCTTAGTKAGVCTLCNETIVVETYAPLGHTDIHGKCERCETDQNNIYVAATQDLLRLQIMQVWLERAYEDGMSAANSLSRTYIGMMYFDDYFEEMMEDLAEACIYAIVGEWHWSTADYSYPATKFADIYNGYATIINSTKYKNWKSSSYDYYSSSAYSSRSGALSLILTVIDMEEDCQILINYLEGLQSSDAYQADVAATTSTLICYDGEFKINSTGNIKISFDSFNPSQTTGNTYVVEITDGENTYQETADSVFSTGSVTFSNCSLIRDSKVTLNFYENNTKIATFDLYTK